MIDIKEIADTVIRGEPALKFPLTYYSWGQEVRDANGNLVLQMRGWGRLQYHNDGHDAAAVLQDKIGQLIVVLLNDAYAKTL